MGVNIYYSLRCRRFDFKWRKYSMESVHFNFVHLKFFCEEIDFVLLIITAGIDLRMRLFHLARINIFRLVRNKRVQERVQIDYITRKYMFNIDRLGGHRWVRYFIISLTFHIPAMPPNSTNVSPLTLVKSIQPLSNPWDDLRLKCKIQTRTVLASLKASPTTVDFGSRMRTQSRCKRVPVVMKIP